MKLNHHNVRTRFTLRDDAAGGAPLELPRRNAILPGIVVAGMFAIFAGVLVHQIARLCELKGTEETGTYHKRPHKISVMPKNWHPVSTYRPMFFKALDSGFRRKDDVTRGFFLS